MAWMVFVLAGINPTPPTAADLYARNTQDLSFGNMNSTAIALAQQMLVNMMPSPAYSGFLPVTGRETVTPTASVVVTLKPVYTNVVYSPTPYRFAISPTLTHKKRDTPVPTFMHTSVPTNTLHPPTATTIPPTITEPPIFTAIPTQPVPPTPTDLPTLVPTEPPIPTPSNPPTEPPVLVEPTSTSPG